jgi:hypothetical protein
MDFLLAKRDPALLAALDHGRSEAFKNHRKTAEKFGVAHSTLTTQVENPTSQAIG